MKNNKKSRDAKREQYWNEDYVRYWMERVGEANNENVSVSKIVKGDSMTTTDQICINAITLLKITKTDEVIELACGFGRSLPMLCQAAKHVTAVDISNEMINIAQDSTNEKNICFYVYPSEDLPFPDQVYDVVVCFAAFDAMYQAQALIEMNRICKAGARVLITGKNDNYDDDDDAAFNAEIGAREKNHPNYFTDVLKLTQNIKQFGFTIDVQQYYLRRGDFGSAKYQRKMPDKFYEYLFILRKINKTNVSQNKKISNPSSKTYIRRISEIK
jgi:ubiquinone/menaquinone biosynthesis C-methylase UbiE